MGVTRFPDGINLGNESGGTATFSIGGTVVNLTAAALNALVGSDSSGKEIAAFDGTVAGTASLSSGLSTVDHVVASLVLIDGTAATQARTLHASTAGVAAGNVAIRVEGATGATVSGTVHCIAYGDA